MRVRRMTCRHPDVRKFDGIRCCLACGEAVLEPISPAPASATAGSQYCYRKLNYVLGQEIRLVELRAGQLSDPVKCDIVHVNLEDKPVYDAVSYTWATENGDASLSKLIHVSDGGSVKVTANCEAVLRQLRNRGTR